MGLLFVTQALAGCKSPEEIGFDAVAQFTAPMAAIGADTATLPCDERLAMFEEFIGMADSVEHRTEVAGKVEGALEKDGFDQGFDRMADIPQKVLEAFEHDCPAETPKARELALGVAKDLHIESKVPWLNK